MPKVSVILTSYNHEKYIRAAIDSVLNQTFTNFELIIWDDASTDNSWSVINSYSDLRVRKFRNEKREWGGLVNKVILTLELGEYIAIHHSDDVWESNKLEKQVAILDEKPKIGAVFTNALAIDESGFALKDEKHFYFNIFKQPNRTRHEWLRFFLTQGNALCHPSVLLRKECYREFGLYRRYLPQVADFDMWIRVCLKFEIYVLPDKLTKFRVRDNDANASGDRADTKVRRTYEFYKLLLNYRQLAKFDELVKVFPEAEKFFRNDETDVDFALAMSVLELNSFRFTKLFAQDILFEIISDSERSKNIKRLYGFDERDFITLTGKNDVFSIGEIVDRDAKISEIYTSFSWRLTRPLRYFSRKIRLLCASFCLVKGSKAGRE